MTGSVICLNLSARNFQAKQKVITFIKSVIYFICLHSFPAFLFIYKNRLICSVLVVCGGFFCFVFQYFYFPLRFNCILPEEVHAQLFSNIEQIRDVNRTLLELMEQSTVGQAFKHLGPFLKLYAMYANSHEQALTVLQVCHHDMPPWYDTMLCTPTIMSRHWQCCRYATMIRHHGMTPCYVRQQSQAGIDSVTGMPPCTLSAATACLLNFHFCHNWSY